MSKYKAVIFDMDGVLVDTEQFYAQRREEFFSSHNIPIHHMRHSDFIGGNMREIWPQILGIDFDHEKAEALQTAYLEFKDRTPLPYKELLFPDVKDVLDSLRADNFKIGLASSSAMQDIEEMLDIHGLRSYFESILSGNDLKATKPHPEIYQLSMKALNVKPEETLIIEDSEKGITAGKAAGAMVWAIEDMRFGMDQSAADAWFPNLTSVKKELERTQ
ncbi:MULTISPECIES: HAD family hydrolase [Lactococcus]|uniref:HAD family hydrolase n=1 Tax=Lactococcus TaxID=1357 RepID=UPI000EF09BB0|nr:MULTISPECIES: HAD family phosphatase [Lactococcus]MBL3716506.1 HAD-IA family hydrolase [Lactococcus garvieae]HAP16120.1 HAD family hydrolase [Lactococcus sp.]